nr:sigma-70 family RNA polymerase sigma factor [Novosphingobium sp. FKTRR1]
MTETAGTSAPRAASWWGFSSGRLTSGVRAVARKMGCRNCCPNFSPRQKFGVLAKDFFGSCLSVSECIKITSGLWEGATQLEGQHHLARRRALAAWVAREIVPHEGRVRAWFARKRLSPEDIDELMQEAYCRIAMLDGVDHIDSGHAYFFSVARNLLLRQLKRQRIVQFEEIAEIESYRDQSSPSPEDQAANRQAYDRVRALIADLPERCGRIVELRKIEGWSQKEIAAHFGMTEKAVEKQVWVGVRAVREGWLRQFAKPAMPGESPNVARERKAGEP